MGSKRRRVIIIILCLMLLCTTVSLAYLLWPPAPLPVMRQIKNDLPLRSAVQYISHPYGQSTISSLLEEISPHPYYYDVLEAVPINNDSPEFNLRSDNDVNRLLCVSVELTYKTPARAVGAGSGRSNPETIHYIAYQQENEWKILYLNTPTSNCG